jgi:exo-1,4-beta-D-glucosaminidase
LQEFIPAQHLWPIDRFWDFHAGGQQFKNIDRFRAALTERYGKPRDLPDFLRKSEAMAYDGERAMFEAFGRNKYAATGVIQWMMNNAWPSLIWHLYDYELRPAGGFFGTKKACEPLHVQYSYDDHSVVVVNDTPGAQKGLSVRAWVYDLDWKERFTQSAVVDVDADGVVRAFVLSAPTDLPRTYFLRLLLLREGATVSRNFYSLSTQADVLDSPKATWYRTPTRKQADLTALADLPSVVVKASSARVETGGREAALQVHVVNTSTHPAFLVRLRLVDSASGADIRPVFWEDNYFELAPGEARELRVSYPAGPAGQTPAIAVGGFNVLGEAPLRSSTTP